MSNRIVIETDVLKHVRSQMDKLQSGLTHLADRLQSITLDQASGGDLSINATLRLPFSGTVQQGGTISQAIRAYGRGLKATSRQVQRLANALHEAQAETERTENLLLREIGELATGQESDFLESDGAMMDHYVLQNEYSWQIRESLQAANGLWKTAYSEQTIQEMCELIYTDFAFDELAWSMMSGAEREATARTIAAKIMRVFGTEADVVVLTREKPERVVTRNGKRYILSLSDGVVASYSRAADCIIINVEDETIDEATASIAHELRHSVQQDIVNASPAELAQKYDIDGTEYDELVALQKELRDGFENYVTPSDEKLIEARAKEIMAERSPAQMGWFVPEYRTVPVSDGETAEALIKELNSKTPSVFGNEKNEHYISWDKAMKYARSEIQIQYLKQLVEVDASQTETAVHIAFSEQSEKRQLRRAAFFETLRKRKEEGTGR